jgi:copper chaperone CopZ
MFKSKIRSYLVDGLTEEKAQAMVASLRNLNEVEGVDVSVSRATVRVKSKRDLEDQVKIACDIAGVKYRTKVM